MTTLVQRRAFIFTIIGLLVTFVLIAIQVQFYFLYRDLDNRNESSFDQKKVAIESDQKDTISSPASTETYSAELPEKRFIAKGHSLTLIHSDGTEEIIISDLSEKIKLGISGTAEVIAQTGENTVVVGASCWEGNYSRTLYKINAKQKTIIQMMSEVPCKFEVEPRIGNRFQQYLVYPGSDGDRFVRIDLLNDESKEVGILPKPYTYIKSNDESGYSKFIIGNVKWSEGFWAEVFDGNAPINTFDYRLPIMMNYID